MIEKLMVVCQKMKKMGIKLVIHKSLFMFRKKVQCYKDKMSKESQISVLKETICKTFDNFDLGNVTEGRLENLERECQLIIDRKFWWLGMERHEAPLDTWNMDFISGYKWENEYFQKIKTVDLSRNVDVKIPWEMSRLQHLYVFAEAYKYTGEQNKVDYIKEQLHSWQSHNPYKNSVNWTCAMEVAIRAINIIFIVRMLPNELLDTEENKKKMLLLLYLHGKYINENLECYDKYNNNHYLSDLLGLLWIGCFLADNIGGNELKESKKWIKFANKQFEKEILVQVNEDGTSFESSIAYHRLVTEIFLLVVYINKVYGIPIQDTIIERLDKMLYFLKEVRKPNGNLPMVGDVDDGRVVILENYSSWDRRKCDFLFERKSQYMKGSFGAVLDSVPPISKNSVAFKTGGYYLLRNETWYCFIHCGPLSLHGHGGHSHNDQLSVVLSVKGKDFIIDPGVGCYSGNAKLRNLFRSTAAHSTLRVIGKEQNCLIEERIFEMPEKTFSQCNCFSENAFEGQHRGYSDDGIIHKRSIDISENVLVISDSVMSSGVTSELFQEKKWELNFILDKDVVVKRKSKNSFDLRNGDVTIRIHSGLELFVEEMDVSYSYGIIVKSMRIKTEMSNVRNIITKFEVLNGGN